MEGSWSPQRNCTGINKIIHHCQLSSNQLCDFTKTQRYRNKKRENPTDFIKSVSSQKSERRNSDIFDLWLNKSAMVILQWNWPQLVGLWVWFVCVMRIEKLQASWVCTHQWSITTQKSLWWRERRRGQKEDVVLNLLDKTTPANYFTSWTERRRRNKTGNKEGEMKKADWRSYIQCELKVRFVSQELVEEMDHSFMP